MKWFSWELLTQTFKRNVFVNRDNKCPRTALRNKVLSINQESTNAIAKSSECLVRFLEVLSSISDDETDHVLSNEDWWTLPTFR
jgi:hypothetical protein